MKRRKIKGRCYIKGKQRGYLRRMRQKERERIKIRRYNKMVANIYGEGHSNELIHILWEESRKRRGESVVEKNDVVHAPDENPAVWIPREYKGYVTL